MVRFKENAVLRHAGCGRSCFAARMGRESDPDFQTPSAVSVVNPLTPKRNNSIFHTLLVSVLLYLLVGAFFLCTPILYRYFWKCIQVD